MTSEGRSQLEGGVGRGDAGDLGVVIRGCHLDDVRADQVEAGERAQDGQQLAAGQPASLWRPGAGFWSAGCDSQPAIGGWLSQPCAGVGGTSD